MGNEQALRVAFFALFSLMMAIRAYYGWQARRSGRSSWAIENTAIDREGRWSVWVRGLMFMYMLAAVILYALNPDWLGKYAIPISAWARWIGAALSAASLPLLIWVHHTLGQYWSTNLRLRDEHQLVTSGPYSWIRHPMYTALFGFFIGLSLVSASWIVVALAAGSIMVLYRRIDIEEQMLIEQFGDAYRVYMERTGRLLPRLDRN